MTAAAIASPTPTMPITTAVRAAPPAPAARLLGAARRPPRPRPTSGSTNGNARAERQQQERDAERPRARSRRSPGRCRGGARGARDGGGAARSAAGGRGLGARRLPVRRGAGGGSGGVGGAGLGSGGAGSKRGGGLPAGARGGSQPRTLWLVRHRPHCRSAARLEGLAEPAATVAERGERAEAGAIDARAGHDGSGRRSRRPARPSRSGSRTAGPRSESRRVSRSSARQLVAADVAAVLEQDAPVEQRVHRARAGWAAGARRRSRPRRGCARRSGR